MEFKPLRVSATELLFLILLSSTNSIHAKDSNESKNLSPNLDVKPVEEFIEESPTEDQFSLQSATTTESTTTVGTYQKLTLSIDSEKNVSREFRPSVHLGEIKESRISTGPFNSVAHFSLENGVDPSYHEHLKDFRMFFQPAVQTPQTDHRANFHQNLFDAAMGTFEETKKDGLGQSYVKFQDDAIDIPDVQYVRPSKDQMFHQQFTQDVPRVRYGSTMKDQAFHQQFAQSVTENVGTQYDLVDQQVFQNLERPVLEQEATSVWGKPSKFQGETQKYEVASVSSVDSLKTPYYMGFYEQQTQQPNLQEIDPWKKPNNGVVYVQDMAFMRTRKFPYLVHQPHVGYHKVELLNGGRPSQSLKNRISPWKKILHLIGAILPLGLLVAALTPSVVKVDNTTQPNIVLSKWRVADLPVEHKQARFVDPSFDCEERSICDMILAGGDAESTVLQNILWNLATRTSTAMAKESGLHEVFEAVKKKDCSSVFC
ncbi:PREDICTED: uncharacterized protein LOC108553589 [Eufriesea mexicana]|uniref:uncharacterized protein LOC108553589 n=1 Tax=Eufriesea mexicana TaxID=516756 RepID=UPI00083C22A6|nr:PREDICTED: uncharacterized protein LOC108553589 [Eufriesea mexicana]